MGTKNRNRRIADFFLLYHYPFRVLFSTYYTKLSFVVVKKYDNTNNKDNISISKKCCPRLSLVVVKKKSRQHLQQRQHFYLIPKVLSKIVPRCRQKKSRQHRQQRQHFFLIPTSVVQGCPSLSSKKHDNKDSISFLFQKCCPRLSIVVVKKNTTT